MPISIRQSLSSLCSNSSNLRQATPLMQNDSTHTDQEEDQSPEAGLTLIECLVAIVVIAATIGVIAPITVLAVATRVQNQRAEQASLIAQAEIDRVRLTVERGGNYTLDDVPTTTLSNIEDVPPPENLDNDNNLTSTTEARRVDINGDGTDDFAVQLFRTFDPANVVDGSPVAFELGVRVYKARSVEDLPASSLGTDPISLVMTSGEGNASTRPLAALYTTVVKSDGQESLCDYYRYIDSSSTVPGAC